MKIQTVVVAGLFAGLIGANTIATDVVTYRNDNQRTGRNLAETRLKPSTVGFSQFGKVFSHSVDGQIYAQPLYLSNVAIPGKGIHDVVFVATEHDSVYAFDAHDGSGGNAQPLWTRSFIGNFSGTVVATVSSTDVNCDDLVPELGITATPVIDPAAGTLYVEVRTKVTDGAGTTFHHQLHALDVTSGADKLTPVEVQGTVAGTGAGSVGGFVTFDPLTQSVRSALLLSNGVIYFGSASSCDIGVYHGWVFSYDAATLAPKNFYCTTPNGSQGGVWMGGSGIATDASGQLFFQTGNGTFDADVGGPDMGDSIIHMTASLGLVDWFTPYNQASLNSLDYDLGSGGLLLLPDQPGAAPHLSVSGSKIGAGYLVNRDNLSHFHSDFDHIVQAIPGGIGASFSTPGLFGSTVYFGGDLLRAFALSNGLLSTSPTSQSPTSFRFPFTNPVVSSNGSQDGIVWVIRRAAGSGPAVLEAFDATNVATQLYNSNQAGTRDQPGIATKFCVATVANGNVYVGTQTNLSVYGCLPPTAAASGGAVICAGSSTPLTGSGGVSCSWLPATGLSDASSCTPTATPSGTTTYTLTVVNANGCASTNNPTVTVTVNPKPAAPSAGNDGPICAGGTLHLTASTIANATYSWTGPDGFTSSLQNPSIASATAAAAGTYLVTATVNGCTGPAGSTTATVNPLPSAVVTAPSQTCANSTGNIASVPDAGTGATYAWTITGGAITGGAGTRSIFFTAGSSGTVTLGATVTTAAGCAATGGATVTIPGGCPLSLYTVPPCRLMDTRQQPPGPYSAPSIDANSTRTVTVAGQCGVPLSATAVAINVTVTSPGADGFLTIYPAGGTIPFASSANFRAGQTRANNVISGLNDAGDLGVFCAMPPGPATADVIIDVTGYFQ